MRVFVTGGTGFIGRAVVNALKGHELRVLTRTQSNATAFLPVDQTWMANLKSDSGWLRERLAKFSPEVCVHLAWEGIPDFSPATCKRNYDLTAGLFDLLDCKVVGIGSCFEYGDLQGCVKEDMAPANLSYFAATKTALRLYGERRFGDRFVWVRPFYVYGPGQRKESLIPSAYAAMKRSDYFNLKYPETTHDFVYVDDVAEGVAKLATSDVPGGVYNLGTGNPRTAKSAVDYVGARTLPPEVTVLGGFWADMTKTKAALGWSPGISLGEGIRRTVAAWEAK